MSELAVRAHGLHKRYGTGEGLVRAVDGATSRSTPSTARTRPSPVP